MGWPRFSPRPRAGGGRTDMGSPRPWERAGRRGPGRSQLSFFRALRQDFRSGRRSERPGGVFLGGPVLILLSLPEGIRLRHIEHTLSRLGTNQLPPRWLLAKD
jgi:hypothetical protein